MTKLRVAISKEVLSAEGVPIFGSAPTFSGSQGSSNQ